METVTHFVYGSLKEGLALYRSYMPVSIIKKNVPLAGYRMYRIHESYPCIVFTGNPDEVVKGELMAYPIETSRALSAMECKCGYYAKPEITKETLCLVYVWDPDLSHYLQRENHIQNGVWQRKGW